MKPIEQKTAAKQFAAYWATRGDEKQDTQSFWLSLLRTVYGVENPAQFIQFEVPVKLDHVSYIDGFIPATRVLIEQKSANVDLRRGSRQSDGSMLTPAVTPRTCPTTRTPGGSWCATFSSSRSTT